MYDVILIHAIRLELLNFAISLCVHKREILVKHVRSSRNGYSLWITFCKIEDKSKHPQSDNVGLSNNRLGISETE